MSWPRAVALIMGGLNIVGSIWTAGDDAKSSGREAMAIGWFILAALVP